METFSRLLLAARQAEAALAQTLKARGYKSGECTDGWAKEVQGEVAALAALRAVLSPTKRSEAA